MDLKLELNKPYIINGEIRYLTIEEFERYKNSIRQKPPVNQTANCPKPSPIKKADKEKYYTMSDGTDISQLPYKLRRLIHNLSFSELSQFGRAFDATSKIYNAFEKGNLNLSTGDYIFNESGMYFGYIVGIRSFEVRGVEYFYLDVCIDNNVIKTVRFNPQKHIFDLIASKLWRMFGPSLKCEDLEFLLVQIEVENSKKDGKIVFSKIVNFEICKNENITIYLNKSLDLLIEN